MILKVINHDFIYEMSHLCTVFFPFEKIKDDGEDNIEVVTSANGNEFSVFALQSLCTGMLKNWVKKGQEIIL